MALACLVAVTEYGGKQLWEGILVLPHARRPLRTGWTAYVAFRLATWLLYGTSLGWLRLLHDIHERRFRSMVK